MSVDYKWSLRDLDYGTEEYKTTIQHVRSSTLASVKLKCSTYCVNFL